MTRASCILLACALAGCGDDAWRGWVYPSASENRDSFDLGRFDTLEACQMAGTALLHRMHIQTITRRENPYDKGRVDCGQSCRSDKDKGISVCKDLVRLPLR